MNIRALTPADLVEIAQIHLHAFRGSALTLLGAEAVRRYYGWQLLGPHECYAIGIDDNSHHLAGFCFGGVFRGALSGFVNQNRSFLIIQVLKRPWLILTNPIMRDRMRLGARIRPPIGDSPRPAPVVRSFGILAIAVDPLAQRRGYGQEMMRHAEQLARENGFSQMHLTVAPENHQAIQFYEQEGWQKKVVDGNWKGAMTKVL